MIIKDLYKFNFYKVNTGSIFLYKDDLCVKLNKRHKNNCFNYSTAKITTIDNEECVRLTDVEIIIKGFNNRDNIKQILR